MEGKTPKEGSPPYTKTVTHWPDGTVILLRITAKHHTKTHTYRHTHTHTYTHSCTQSLPPSVGFCLKQRHERHAKALEHENILFWVSDWTHKEASHEQGGWAEVISSPLIYCQVTKDKCDKCAAKRLNLAWHDDAILIFSLLHNTGQDVLCLFAWPSSLQLNRQVTTWNAQVTVCGRML